MFQRQGKKAFKKDLSNIKILTAHLGKPHAALRTIHIAGTNGKGTCAHLIASMLQANGLKVGLYTSPHYRDFRERIKINGAYLSKSYVKQFVQQVQLLIEEEKIKASFFEITVAMAFCYFRDMNVDYAVIETGLGGRLDSTNIINPEICLITNISFDHMGFLGNTLKSIAREKAGIIKKHTPVVIGEHQDETDEVFDKRARQMNAELIWAKNPRGFRVVIEKDRSGDPFLPINIRSALTTYLELTKSDLSLTKDKSALISSIDDFRQRTNYIGRWHRLQENPLIIADSAHNVAGLTFLFEHIEQLDYDQLHIVFGMVGDKDPHLVYNLLPKKAKYYFVRARIPRAKDLRTLQEEAARYDLQGKIYTSVRRGLAMAKRTAHKNDLVLVIGSIFVVAEVI